MGEIGTVLVWLGFIGLVGFGIRYLIVENRVSKVAAKARAEAAERERIAGLRRKYLEHGNESVERRSAAIDAAGGSLLSFRTYFSIQSHSVSTGTSGGTSTSWSSTNGGGGGSSTGWSSGESWQVFQTFVSASLVEFTDGNFVLWKAKEEFRQPVEWINDGDDLYRLEIEKVVEVPVHRIGTIELAPYTEVNHRATSNSFYIYTVLDGKTHIIGTDTELPDAREKAERIREMLKEVKAATPIEGRRRRGGGEGIPT